MSRNTQAQNAAQKARLPRHPQFTTRPSQAKAWIVAPAV
jgi:hypothetical protein